MASGVKSSLVLPGFSELTSSGLGLPVPARDSQGQPLPAYKPQGASPGTAGTKATPLPMPSAAHAANAIDDIPDRQRRLSLALARLVRHATVPQLALGASMPHTRSAVLRCGRQHDRTDCHRSPSSGGVAARKSREDLSSGLPRPWLPRSAGGGSGPARCCGLSCRARRRGSSGDGPAVSGRAAN